MLKGREVLSRQQVVMVHDYQMGTLIGRGSFAQIWSAFHLSSRRKVAMKVISKQKLMEHEYGKVIVFNEVILARILDHPAIVDVHEVADSASQYFQVMRYSEHGDLLKMLRQGSVVKPLSVIDQILSAVEYLHSYGICHRDIKLENILMTEYGPKLSDLGIATMTFDGMMHNNCGSYEYSAPEAIRSPCYNGFKADMWSVGVVFYAIFARSLPFRDVSDNFDYANAEVQWDLIPANVQPLIKRLLSLNPDERPSAAECRAFDVFKAKDRSFKEPLSALKGALDMDIDQSLLSSLSQAMHIPVERLRERLTAEHMNREKVLFMLLSKRSRAVFRLPSNQRSAPVNGPGCGIRREDIHTDSVHVWDSMHSYLVKQRFSISTPISETLVAVQSKSDPLVRLSFSICDKEDGQTTVTLAPNSHSVELADALMAHLRQMFENT